MHCITQYFYAQSCTGTTLRQTKRKTFMALPRLSHKRPGPSQILEWIFKKRDDFFLTLRPRKCTRPHRVCGNTMNNVLRAHVCRFPSFFRPSLFALDFRVIRSCAKVEGGERESGGGDAESIAYYCGGKLERR